MTKHYLQPNWPAPKNIKAYITTRENGYSQAPFNAFNIADYVGDDLDTVNKNIKTLIGELELPESPLWLNQVHGTTVTRIEDCTEIPDADAAYTSLNDKVCAVRTADCLPILLCNRDGTEVAAVHAGWKGLLAGVIDSTISALSSAPDDLLAWMGPALGPKHFEVNEAMRADFINQHPDNVTAFIYRDGRWMMDFYLVATMNLQRFGITQIYGGEHCTFTEEAQFFSYRRDQGVTGRMASLIWIT